MPKGDIDILITAQNKASTHLKDVAKDSRDAAKASTALKNAGLDIAGSFFGLDEISSQVRDLTDSMNELGESASKATVQAKLLKAGLIAAVAAVSFKAGTKISETLGLGIAQDDLRKIIDLENERAGIARRNRQNESQLLVATGASQIEAIKQQQKAVADAIKATRKSLSDSNELNRGEDTFFNRTTEYLGFATALEQTRNAASAHREELKRLGDEQANLNQQQAILNAQKEAEQIQRAKDAEKERIKSVVEMTRALRDQVAAMKMSAKELAIQKAEKLGVKTATLKQIAAYHDEINALKKAQQAQRENIALRRQAQSVAQQIQERQQDLREMRNEATRQRNHNLNRNAGPVQFDESRFLRRGVVKADPTLKENQQQTKIQKDLKKLSDLQTKLLERIADNQEQVDRTGFRIVS